MSGEPPSTPANPLERSSDGLTPRRKVAFRKSYGDIELREFSNIDVDGAVIIEGFPSVSLTSVLSAGYIREQLKLPLVGIMSSHKFPPRCVVEAGIAMHPIRIFGDKRMVIMVCEFKIEQPEITYAIVEAILDFAERHHASKLITVEGLPIEEGKESEEDSGKLRFVSTNKSFIDFMLKQDAVPVEDAIITGVTGLILAEGALNPKVDVVCLLSPTSSKLQGLPDVESSVTVVKLINSYLPDLQIDLTPLEEKAKKIKSTVSKFIKQSHTPSTHPSMFS